MSAVWLIVRAELRRRRVALVAIGVLAGLTGAVVVGAATTARRTGTAYDRLLARSGVGEAQVLTMTDDPTAPQQVLDLEGVAGGWIAGFSVAQVAGDEVNYMGILSGPDRDPGVYDPPLVAGRLPDPESPFEVTMVERLASPFGVEPGTKVAVNLLAAEEVGQFGEFGDPDGPSIELEITGIVRSPIPVDAIAPLTATPAFHRQFGAVASAGALVIVDLEEGEAGTPDFARRLDALRSTFSLPAGFEEFAAVEATYTQDSASASDGTASVLVTGLVAFGAVAALAGLATTGLALRRHHESQAESQAVERALGLTTSQRAAARVVPAGLAAAVAAASTFAGGLVAGLIEPLGGLKVVEPNAGWAPNVAVIAAAVAAMALVVVVVSGLSAAISGRTRDVPRARLSRIAERVGALGGAPAPVVGIRFALESGRGQRAVPLRSGIAGAAVALVGVVGVGIFTASLDRLVDTPERWGGSADFIISDVGPSQVREATADPRLGALAISHNNNIVIEGRHVTSYGNESIRGAVTWSILEGRLPTADDDVVLGSRLAQRLGRGVGDTAEIKTASGSAVVEVVGIGVGPATSGEALGDAALFTPEGLARAGLSGSFDQLLVTVAETEDADAVAREYAGQYEVTPRERPPAIEDLNRLGHLPAALGLFLVVLGLAALANGLIVGVRRRGPTIAILRTVGFTPRQAAQVPLVMAATTAVVALGIGVPVGAAVARVVWTAVAEGAGVAPDPLAPTWLALTVPAAVIVSLAIGLIPARRASASPPASLLRAE